MGATVGLLASLWVGGCYQSHELGGDAGVVRDDAARPPDAGPGCGPASLGEVSLRCPATARPGQRVAIGVEATHRGCCARGVLSATPRSTGPFAHELALDASVCDCCDLCECIGPMLSAEVTLEGLAPGTHTVHAGGASCIIEVSEPVCAPLEVSEVRAPAVLFEGQTFAMSAWAPSAGCGCAPELSARDGGFDASTCGCCEVCDCIDPTYELSYAGELPGSSFEVGGVRVEVERRAMDTCLSLGVPATGGVEVLPPRADVRRSGPPIWWVRLRNESARPECCGPLAGIETAASAENEHRVILRDCTSPCRCAGPPGQLEAWLPIVDPEPGEHRVVAAGADGGEVVTFTVPE